MRLNQLLQALQEDNFDLETIRSNRIVFFPTLKQIYKNFSTPSSNFYDINLAKILINSEERSSKTHFSRDEIRRIFADIFSLGLESVYELENHLTFTIAKMEEKGILIDLKKLKALQKTANEKIQEIEREVFSKIGSYINLNSPKQVAKLLFEDLNLPTKDLKRGKTGYSTDYDTLVYLSQFSELPNLILQHRLYGKAKSAFIDPLIKKSKNEIIYPRINQIGTATGRITYENPNIQALPIKDEFMSKIRDCILAGKNRVFIRADYSQIELRILAHLSKDPYLINAFNTDKDIHSETARLIFNLKKDSIVQPWQRSVGKTVNFSILYGTTIFGLAKALSTTEDQASLILKNFFLKLSGVDDYFKNLTKKALKEKKVNSILGRIRWINNFKGSERIRVIRNSPIQASASDLIKIAMKNITDQILQQKLDSHIQIQIHDELIINTAKDSSEIVASIVKNCMETAYKLDVPLKVEISKGETWYETTIKGHT